MTQKITEVDMLLHYRNNPIKFLTEILDVKKEHVWDKMVEISNSVRDNQFTCVKAGNSLSKSYTVGRLALWFLYTHNPSTVFTTAPSNVQVEDILWREIRNSHSQAKGTLGGKVLKTSLELDEKWFATGFATKADSGEEEATRILGFHNEDMLIILDEAPGVDAAIWNAIDRLITTPRVKILVIGNPVYSSGNFVDCFKDPKYNKITVSAFDTPNYKQNREVVPGLAGRPFVKIVRDKFGEGSNQWKSMITGEIPDEDADSLIPRPDIEEAFKRKRILPKKTETKRIVVWDVADGGGDLNTIYCWEDMKLIEKKEVAGRKIEEVVLEVWKVVRRNNANTIVWDNDGRGRIAGGLLALSSDVDTELMPFEGSSREVYDSETFYNVKDEAAWVMRDYFIAGNIMLQEKDPDLEQELLSIREDTVVGSTQKAKYIKIESKKDEKKRLKRSPDKRDNVMMACYADKYFNIREIDTKNRYATRSDTEYQFNPMTC